MNYNSFEKRGKAYMEFIGEFNVNTFSNRYHIIINNYFYFFLDFKKQYIMTCGELAKKKMVIEKLVNEFQVLSEGAAIAKTSMEEILAKNQFSLKGK